MMGFKKHLKGIDPSNIKSKVDKYLAESCVDVLDEKFDIWLGGRLILHSTMCFQELNDMFLQFQYPLWPQNLHLLRLVVFLIPSRVHCLHCGGSPHLWSKLARFFIGSYQPSSCHG